MFSMPNWHATVRGTVLHVVHSTPDDELDCVGAWDIILWRGAPSWESDPELEHAALGVMLPELHKGYIRHAWTFDIPDRYLGAKNTGDNRQWMTLQGGSWTIVLRFPTFTPAAVYRAVVAGFHAQRGDPQEERRKLAQLAEQQAAADLFRPESPIRASQAVRHDTPPARKLTPAARAAL